MAETSNSNSGSNTPAQTGAQEDALALSQLSPAELQALAEKVLALLKRDLRLERERLNGR